MKKITIEKQLEINGGGKYTCPKTGPMGEECGYTTDWYILYLAHINSTHAW